MVDKFYIYIMIVVTLLYGIGSFIIFKRLNKFEISIRSPVLLLINNVGGYLMIMTYLIYDYVLKNTKNSLSITFCEILPDNYVIFHFLMIISFILRCHRVVSSVNIRDNENDGRQEFNKKRYLFTERYYIKILLVVILILLALTYFINYVISNKNTSILIVPFHFQKCFRDANLNRFNEFTLYFWTILNLIECSILLTYTYFISKSEINFSIKVELFTFLICWIANTNALRVLDFFGVKSSNVNYSDLIFEGFILICLFANTYLPIIYSYMKSNEFNLHFTSKLVNNFFLFLTNEICFKEFFLYLHSNKFSLSLIYLEFYIRVIALKLNINLGLIKEAEIEIERILSDYRNQLYIFGDEKSKGNINEIFSDENRKNDLSIFDEPLCIVYNHLHEKFEKFQKSDSYNYLVSKINLHSDVFCRMYNTGLIRKN